MTFSASTRSEYSRQCEIALMTFSASTRSEYSRQCEIALTLTLTLTLNLALALTLTLSERNALLWRPVNYNLAIAVQCCSINESVPFLYEGLVG